MKLFLDDIRNPPDCSWVVARSYNEAIALVEQHGFPQEVSFDHDLGLVDCPLTGFSFAKYLVNLDIDTATMPENTRCRERHLAHSVLTVANEFLLRAGGSNSLLTAMQLQKLCYLAHGFTLALLDRPLTSDRIEAWEFGPVYPVLYDAVKQYGPAPITEPIARNNWALLERIRGAMVKEPMDDHEQRILETVWKDYGRFEAFKLSALTHENDSPWAKVYRPGRRNLVISDDLIKAYFVELTRPGAARFFFTVHSANPVGAANILGLLEGYGKFKLEEKK